MASSSTSQPFPSVYEASSSAAPRGERDEAGPMLVDKIFARRESASSASTTATHSSSSHSPRSSGSSAHFQHHRRRKSHNQHPVSPLQSPARKANKMAVLPPLPPGAPADFLPNHHRQAGTQHEDAPAGFLANHHRQTSGSISAGGGPHRKSKSGGSIGSLPWTPKRSNSGPVMPVYSGESEEDQRNNGGYSSQGGTISYSPSGGIGFSAGTVSPPSTSGKKWLGRTKRSHSNASSSQQSSVVPLGPGTGIEGGKPTGKGDRSRKQSNGSSQRGSVLGRYEDEAGANSRRMPISPRVTPSNSIRATRSDVDSASSHSHPPLSHQASNHSLSLGLGIPPASPTLSETYSSDHSRYSNASNGGEAKRKSKRIVPPATGGVIPARRSSMTSPLSPLTSIAFEAKDPNPALHGNRNGGGSDRSSYPTSPSVGDFPAANPLDALAERPLESPESMAPLASPETLRGAPVTTPTPKLETDLGIVGVVPVPQISPNTAKLLNDIGGSAQHARPDANAIPARDLAAEPSSSSSTNGSPHIPLIPMRTSSSEGRKQAHLGQPVDHQSSGFPSPSPSEDAQRLEDLYGQYGSATPEMTESDGRLPVFQSEDTPTLPPPSSFHSRDASSHYVEEEDLTTPLPRQIPFEAGLAAPQRDLGPERSPVLDELDGLIGRAMEDVHALGLTASPPPMASEVAFEEPTAPVYGLGVPTIEFSDSVSLAPSVEYEDAPAELGDRTDFVSVLPLTGPSTSVTSVSVDASPVSSSREVETIGELSDHAVTPTNLSPLATPRHQLPAFIDRNTLASAPSSPSQARPSARPAPTRSSSTLLMQTQWQAMQQRQAKAAELLRRNRPLPPSMEFADVKKLRTSGERAKAYAMKINALAKEESGLDIWIERVRDQRSGQTYSSKPIRSSPLSPSGQVSPPKFRSSPAFGRSPVQGHPREVSTTASIMSFPTRPDAGRAVEIVHASSTAQPVMEPVNLPYPGVYNPNHSGSLPTIPSGGSSGHNSARATPSPSGLAAPVRYVPGARAAGFLSTIGRRGSRKAAGRPNLQISAPVPESVFMPDSTVPLQPVRNAGLGGPRGPRMLNTPLPRQSPARPSSTQFPAAPTPPSYSPTSTLNPQRTSFAYGTTRQPSKDVVAPPPQPPKDPLFEEKIQRLQDILPQANRDTLGDILRQENGDDLAAIGAYLEAEKAGRA